METISSKEIDAFFDERGFKPGGIFNEDTGEVTYQAIGDNVI